MHYSFEEKGSTIQNETHFCMDLDVRITLTSHDRLHDWQLEHIRSSVLSRMRSSLEEQDPDQMGYSPSKR